MTDQDVLDEVATVAEYWQGEAEGRITDFVLPTGPRTRKFATFETTVDPAVVCEFGNIEGLVDDAVKAVPGRRLPALRRRHQHSRDRDPGPGLAEHRLLVGTAGYAPPGRASTPAAS